MNVERRFLGTSVVRVRVLAAGLALLAAGGIFLGWGSRSRQTAANAATASSSIQSRAASPLAVVSNPSREARPVAQSRAVSLLARLPLMFEPNLGQANLDAGDPRVRFVARGSGYGLFLGTEGAILSLSSHDASKHQARVERLQMKLAGANRNAALAGADLLPGKSNYFFGNDPAKWRHDVPQFAGVRYENVYPGINLVFYGNQGHLEYDFQVAPGSDPAQAELEFDGAKQLELKEGALVIKGESGSVRLEAPRVYQEIAGRQELVQSSFVLRGAKRAGFAIGAYDHARELVIDPVLTFSTYFGGTGDELATSVAVDSGGNIYLTGSTTSPSLATAGVTQTTLNGTQNAYVAKIQPPQGSNPPLLVYVTYLGGGGPDTPVGIAVDGAGNAYIAGTTQSGVTSSVEFPTTATAYQNAPLPASTGTQHVFVTELNTTASQLLYSSYLSGNGTDTASGMTIDAGGNIYVTGTTTSNDAGDTSAGIEFPASALQPFQPLSIAGTQFFVTKVNTKAPKTGSIAYSTYFGGANFVAPLVATGGGIAVDTNGNIYFAGTTNFLYTGCVGCGTTDFPIKNAFQPCLNAATPTVLGNPAQCPTTGTTAHSDAFLAKLNPNGPAGSGQLLWSTYLGGTQDDFGTGIALDTGAANVYLTGTTNSTDVTTATTFAAYQPCLNAPTVTAPPCPNTITANDAFVARLTNPATTSTTTTMSLTYFSYLGGSADEAGRAITVDAASGALVTGSTSSPDFPVYPANNDIQGVYGGNKDAFLARINAAAVTGQNKIGSWATYFGGSGIDEGTSVALDVSQNVYFAGDTTSTAATLQMKDPLSTNTDNKGGVDAFVAEVGSAASLGITGTLSIGTNQYVSAGNQATFTYTLTNFGPDLANQITVTDNLQGTGVPVTFVSAATTSGTCSGGSTTTNVTCNIQSLQSGSTATVTIVLTPTASSSGQSEGFNGGTVTAGGANNITPVTVTVPATMSDFTIGVSPNNVSLQAAGATATFQVQVTPHPVYGNSVALSVSGLPTGAASSFTTSSVTLTGTSPVTSTLSISTTARPVITPAASLLLRHYYAVWLCIPGLALLGLGVGGDRRRRRIAGMFLLCIVSLLLLFLPACSSKTTPPPVSGTPAGTYPLVVTATSGSDAKSYPITLTVP